MAGLRCSPPSLGMSPSLLDGVMANLDPEEIKKWKHPIVIVVVQATLNVGSSTDQAVQAL